MSCQAQDGKLADERIFDGGALTKYLVDCGNQLLIDTVFCLKYSTFNTTNEKYTIGILPNNGEYKPEKSTGVGCNPICKKVSGDQPEPNRNENLLIGFFAALAGIALITASVLIYKKQVYDEFYH